MFCLRVLICAGMYIARADILCTFFFSSVFFAMYCSLATNWIVNRAVLWGMGISGRGRRCGYRDDLILEGSD